jgi:hypothetical protein
MHYPNRPSTPLLALLLLAAVVCIHAANAGAERAYSPKWPNEIVYVLIPSRFKDGDPSNNCMCQRYHLPDSKYDGGFLGGDIAGIRQKVPYLKGLGVTAVLLYPMFENDEGAFPGRNKGYLATGYRVRNYSAIDRNFGTEAEFKSMIDELHSLPLYWQRVRRGRRTPRRSVRRRARR